MEKKYIVLRDPVKEFPEKEPNTYGGEKVDKVIKDIEKMSNFYKEMHKDLDVVANKLKLFGEHEVTFMESSIVKVAADAYNRAVILLKDLRQIDKELKAKKKGGKD